MSGSWTILKRGLTFRFKTKPATRALAVQQLEDRITPVAYTPAYETLRSFFGFEQSFSHGLSVASGDENGDGVADIIAGSGPGAEARIAVIDGKTGSELRTFLPFAGFTGGASVASGDVNGDGIADIITAAGPGGGPEVKIFDGLSGRLVRSFGAYAENFTGGVSVATADVTGDGLADIITGAGPGGGPHVKVFDGATGVVRQSFLAYAEDFAGGITVSAGDVTGDGVADIITGAGLGGGPHVNVFDGVTGQTVRSFFAYSSGFVGGVSVSSADITGDGIADIITGAGPGGGPHVTVIDGRSGETIRSFFAYSSDFSGGVSLASADFNNDGITDIVTGTGPGGGPHIKAIQVSKLPDDSFPPPIPPPPLPRPPIPPPPANFDLTGWTPVILGGSDPGRGTIGVANGVLTLAEGNSFRVGLSHALTIPTAPSAIQVTFESPNFDVSSLGLIQDAFEIAVLDAAGQPLALPIAADRDASFNWSELLTPQFAPGTTGDTSTATINLSALPVGTATQIVLRLVNNDTDNGTSVRIRRVDTIAAPGTAPSGMRAPAERTASTTKPDFTLLADVTPSARVEYGATTLAEDRTILTTDVSLRNIGTYDFAQRSVLVLSNLSDPAVRVLNPDGYTPDGKAYFDLTSEMNGTSIRTGQTTAKRMLQFTNPNRERFQYDVQVLSLLNKAPVFNTQPVQLLQAGGVYIYHAGATDLEGQPVRYSLDAGPEGLTIDAATGDLRWYSAPTDVGEYAVRLRATDSLGGTTTQSYTLSVRAEISNRPPIITSTPNTDATVAGAWNVTTYKTGDHPTGLAAGNFGGGKTGFVSINAGDQTVGVLGGTQQPFRVGEQAPTGRTFQTGHEVNVGLPNSVQGSDDQSMPDIAQADLNGDGNLDFITIASKSVYKGQPNYDYDSSNFVSVTMNNGDGTFAEPTILTIETFTRSARYEANARNLTVADFDGDGKADILALYGKLGGYYGNVAEGQYQLLFWKGLGNGQFAALQKTDTASPLEHIRAGDIDGDDKLDLVAVNAYYSQLGVLKGNGDGTFGAFTAIPTYAGAVYFQLPAIADLDGKNGLDVVYNNFQTARVDIYLNDGTGQLAKATSFRPNSYNDGTFGLGRTMTAGDFNSDGKVDLIASGSGGLVTLLGAGDGTTFTELSPLADVNDKSIAFKELNNLASPTPIDINGDGNLDLLYGHVDLNRGIVVGLGQGDGKFRFQRYELGNDPTNSYDTNQDDTAVLAGDYNRDGVIDLAVSTVGNSRNSHSALTIIDGITPGEFATPKQAVTGSSVQSSLIGDLNNDGTPDIVYWMQPGPYYTGLFRTKLGNGDGSFAVAQSALAVSGSPINAYLRDVNNDGKLDLVCSLIGQSGTVYGINQVALGNGDGTFTTSFSTYRGNYFYGNSLVTGDFNNDGYLDFATFAAPISAGGTGTYVDGFYDLYLNDATPAGTFTRTYNYVLGVGSAIFNPQQITVGDFTGDGKLDILSIEPKTSTSPAQILILRGKGDGTFFDPERTSNYGINTDDSTATPQSIASGDVNGDGKIDLVIRSTYFKLGVLLSNGDGSFTTPLEYDAIVYGGNQINVYLRDVNNDGKLDIVEIGQGYQKHAAVSVRIGHGDGSFGKAELYTGYRNTTSLDLGDLDGDGIIDLIATSSFHTAQGVIYTGTKPGLAGVANGDVNGDGKADVLAINTANNHVKILLGNGNETFHRQADLIVGRGPVAISTFDFNADGKLDIVTANRTGKSVTVLTGNGGGGFTRTDISVGVKPVSISVGDLTGDGKADILVADDGSNAAYLLVNTGSGFAAPVAIPLGDKPKYVTLADVTGDGKLDAIFTLPDSKRLLILPGMDNGNFGTPTYLNLSSMPGGLTAGDFNQDGKIDLAVTFPNDDTAAVLYNRGGILFAKPQTIRVGANPTAIIAKDADGDGRLDLIVTNSGDNTASVIKNIADTTTLYHYIVTATDPDGDAVAFELVDAPGGMILDPTTGQIVWAPSADQLGSNAVTIRATDGRGGSATQSFNIAVAPSHSNVAPVFTTTSNPVVSTTEAFNYNAKAIDTDGTALRYRLVNGPAGASIDPLTGKVSWDARGNGILFNSPNRFGYDQGVTVPDRPELRPSSLTLEGWFQFDQVTGS